MIKTENFEKVEVSSTTELRDWLMANHTQDASVWLVTFKKHCGDSYVGIKDVLDELLCFGWIDGIRRKLDDDRTMQLISKRQTQVWAKSYKDRVARLTLEGRMLPAGVRAVEDGKKSGLWDAMADVEALTLPDDLKQALAAQPAALTFFKSLSPSVTRNTLRWIKQAKTAPTRAKRISITVAHAAAGEKVPQM